VNLRDREHDSIRTFLLTVAAEGYFKGAVLDYGCGKQPYRDIVKRSQPLGGVYQPFDQADFPANVSEENIGEGDPLVMEGWGTILCTQVVQYVPDVWDLLRRFWAATADGGHLVMTYPTNWPEIEPEDLHRFTKAGMEGLLDDAGFTILRHERRAVIHPLEDTGEAFALGYGVVARA